MATPVKFRRVKSAQSTLEELEVKHSLDGLKRKYSIKEFGGLSLGEEWRGSRASRCLSDSCHCCRRMGDTLMSTSFLPRYWIAASIEDNRVQISRVVLRGNLR